MSDRWLLPITMMCLAVPAGAQQGRSIAGEMVAAHNAVRARVGVRPLVWSDRLAAHAQTCATELLKRGIFEHRPKSDFGENLYEIRGAKAAPAGVVRDWASEAVDYDYKANTCRRVCGHYTQLVWRGTREVGCGVAQDIKRQVWVCNYNPPGNWEGRKPY